MTSDKEHDASADEDFAALFEASMAAKPIEQGQTIEGTVVAIGADAVFVNVGGKGEATIAIDELRNDDGTLEANVGDRIQAVVTSTAGGLTLSRKLVRGAASLRQLEEAFRAGLAIEGRVERVVKGGYEIRIAQQRAFCPLSQMDTVRGTEPASYEGHGYTFRIIEFKENGRTIVVSRRVLLEEAQRANAAEVRKSIVPGAVITGRVTSVVPFGAFVDLGAGIQGLLHVSEMAWSRVSDPATVVSPGQEVTVRVLRVDSGTQRIALGLKQLSEEPALAGIVAGTRVTGTVERHEKFGVFVAIGPGVTGLMPMSETGVPRELDVPRTFPAGAEIEVMILEVDPASRRIRLSRKALLDAREADEVREYSARAQQPSAGGIGSLADKLRGALTSRQK